MIINNYFMCRNKKWNKCVILTNLLIILFGRK